MQITNYKYGWREKFDCVIHGRITVSWKEWCAMVLYLSNSAVIAAIRNKAGWYSKKLFLEDAQRIQRIKKGTLVNLRVSPTEAIVKKFKPTGKYKRGNYEFLIIK